MGSDKENGIISGCDKDSGMILYIALSIFNPFKFGYFMGKIAPVKPFIAMKSADSYPF